MRSAAVNERLIQYYSKNYELYQPFRLENTIYDTYACCNQFNCFDHAFIRNTQNLTRGDLFRFKEALTTIIEPNFIRKGEDSPAPGHMYSYVTGLFISEKRIREDVRRSIRHFRYYRGYGAWNRGYCQARIAAFDMETGTFIYSPAAKDLMLEYQSLL